MNLRFGIDESYITKDIERKSLGAAGIDIYLPTFNESFKKDFMKANPNTRAVRLTTDPKTGKNIILVNPYFSVLIPTGIYIDIPKDTYIDVGTKSGRFKSTGLKVGSHVIDYDYQGMIYISLFNTTKLVSSLEEGESIAQLIHKKYIPSEPTKVGKKMLFLEVTARGSSGFGSTDGK